MQNGEPGKESSIVDLERLRRQAEELIKNKPAESAGSPADLLELVHELRVHQAELETQNEELRQAQQELSELRRLFEDLYEFAPCGYLRLDGEGIITRSNQAGTMLVRDARTRVLHSGFSRFLAPGYQEVYFKALRESALTGRKQSLELQLGGDRGAHRWVWAEIQAEERTPSGAAEGYRLTLVDISSKKAAEQALAESEKKYRRLFNDMICGALLLERSERETPGLPADVRVVEVNSAFVHLAGLPREEALGLSLHRIWPESKEVWFEAIERTARTGRRVEVDWFHPELGKHLLMSFFQLEGGRIGASMVDISEAKKSEYRLGLACRDLEIVVRERSAELLQVNAELSNEIQVRAVTQKELTEKTEELQSRLVELKEANAALQGLLKARDDERATLEEKMVCNISERIRPYLAKLAEGRFSERQHGLLETISRSLEEIASPLSRRFILDASRLTPVENQVAQLILQGKSTKEIASLLGVARSTVDYHRLNIRRRLGLTKKGTNLQSYLKSLA